jgi:hypothetical protein
MSPDVHGDVPRIVVAPTLWHLGVRRAPAQTVLGKPASSAPVDATEATVCRLSLFALR